jgi:lysophospholipase L1-like esterase
MPMKSLVALAAFLATIVAGAPARAQASRRSEVRVVVHGASVSAYRDGGYGQWLTAACKNIRVDNVSKEKLGATELRERFVQQVLQRGRVNPKAQETWLLFMVSLNSVGNPERTNVEVARTFKLAHDAGFRTMGLTINPWGSESDWRWRGANGLEWLEHSQKVVDFLMGRLAPQQAFGKRAAGLTAYLPGQLPELAIDVWDASLRDRAAPPRPEQPLERLVRSSPWVSAKVAGLEGPAREAALQGWIARAATLPRWFMRRELIGTDGAHPNSVGHKEIARAVCNRAPASWGCDCTAHERLTWDPRTNKPVAR